MATFKFTSDQLRKIYDGDIDARNTFYFDNLDIITRMAYCALEREQHPAVTLDDLVQGAYADMDYFCHSVNRPVTTADEIGFFLRWSFHLAPYGGLAYCRENNPKLTGQSNGFYDTTYTDNNVLSLDATVDDSDKHLQSDATATLAEYIADPRAELTEQSDDEYADCVQAIAEYVTPKMRDCFTLLADGYTDTQIGEKLGITQNTASTRKFRIRAVFAKRNADIVKTLADYGIIADGIADRQPKRIYKTSEKHRDAVRRYRDRKCAENSTPYDVA